MMRLTLCAAARLHLFGASCPGLYEGDFWQATGLLYALRRLRVEVARISPGAFQYLNLGCPG